MRGIFSPTSSAIATLGVLIAAHVHLTFGVSLPGDAHARREVNESERKAVDSVKADRLFPLNSAEDDNAERLLRTSSGTGHSIQHDQLMLRNALSAVTAAAERSRLLQLLRMAAQQQQQQQQHRKMRAVSSDTGSSLNRGFRQQSRLRDTTGRLKGIKPQKDITGTGTKKYT